VAIESLTKQNKTHAPRMIIATILLLSYVVTTQSLSCRAPIDGFTLTNMLHAADLAVVVRIIRDITPKPKPIVPQEIKVNIGNTTHPVFVIQIVDPPRIAGLPDPKYYTAFFQNVLSNSTDYGTGQIIVRGGIACGIGSLKVQTTYLLFGSIRNEKVEGNDCSTEQITSDNRSTPYSPCVHLAPT
jgi:hypothetical protein